MCYQSLTDRETSYNMKLLLISLGLVTLAVQIFCQESAAPTEVGETNEVPASTVLAQVESGQESAKPEDKKLTKRSYGWGPWGWPEYGYGWPWLGWGHGGWGHGGYSGHGGGWYGGWYGGHGWPWWYSGHGKW